MGAPSNALDDLPMFDLIRGIEWEKEMKEIDNVHVEVGKSISGVV